MSQSFQPKGNEVVLPAKALSSLFDLLVQEGFQPAARRSKTVTWCWII